MPEEKAHTIDPRHGRPLTPEEVAPSFSVPAFTANKFVVQPMDVTIRIAFGEEAPNTTTTYYRFAVTLSNRDAVNLYHVLKDSLSAYEDAGKAIAEAGQQAEAPSDG